jgi:hypothetical protein
MDTDDKSSGVDDRACEITRNHLVHFTTSDPRCRGLELPEGLLLLRYTLSKALYFYLRTGIRDGKIFTRVFASDSPYDRQKTTIGDVMKPIFEPRRRQPPGEGAEAPARLGRVRQGVAGRRGGVPQLPG